MALRLSRRMWTLILATDVENNIDGMCHTGILHCVAKVDSLYNNVLCSASKLSMIAMNSTSQIVCDVFSQSSTLIYSSLGYNAIYGHCHKKVYSLQDNLCVDFIRDVRVAPDLNSHLLKLMTFINFHLYSLTTLDQFIYCYNSV